MEQFVNFVIRPPRAEYCLQDLLEPEFTLKGCKYQRKDLEVTTRRGHTLCCSHYMPQPLPENTQLPCVIYCHGNSGCRVDANEAAIVLLPSNITVFTLDFSGSGISDGDYVSLGWNEKEDLQAVVSYLRSLKQISCIGLWGRSMGAVTSLLYGAEDPSIAGMVLDSPFSNLFALMMELVDVYKIRLPKFTVKVAVQIMRKIIQKRAHFDIMDLNPAQVASKSFIPALFGHATEDLFIQPHHSDLIYGAYVGDKNIIKFEGDHNSARPQFYFDLVTIFFHNVLHPPEAPVADIVCDAVYYDSDSFDESLICEVINEFQPSLPLPIISASKSQQFNDPVEGRDTVSAEVASAQPYSQQQLLVNDSGHTAEIFELMQRANSNADSSESSSSDSFLERKCDGEQDDCFSYPSSNCASTESWGRCSSHGISETSEEESSQRQNFTKIPRHLDDEERIIMEAIAASLEEVKPKQYVMVRRCNLGTQRGKQGKLEAFGQLKILLSCLKGMRWRCKGTT